MAFWSDDEETMEWLRIWYGLPAYNQRIEICPVCNGAAKDYEGACVLCAGEGVLPMAVGALDDQEGTR